MEIEFSKRADLSTPVALVNNVLHIVSLPEVYLRLQTVIDDPMHSRDQVAQVISYDTGLSARLLRIANSAYYSFPGNIETISTAVNIIGELDIRNIVLAVSVVKSVSKIDRLSIDLDCFWLHSIKCGLMARQIARQINSCHSEDMFLAGMLHDLGQLILYRGEPELAQAIALRRQEQQQTRDQAEMDLLGFDHAELGGLLARAWNLPEDLCNLIQFHHSPEHVFANRSAAGILALANYLANLQINYLNFVLDEHPDALILCEAADIEDAETVIVSVMDSVERQCAEILSLICE